MRGAGNSNPNSPAPSIVSIGVSDYVSLPIKAITFTIFVI